MINITFPDGSVKQFEGGITPLQIAESISPRLAQDVLAASVNEQEWDLTRPIDEDASIKLFKWDDPEGQRCPGRQACFLAQFGSPFGRGSSGALSRCEVRYRSGY